MTHQRLFASSVVLLLSSGFAMAAMDCGSNDTTEFGKNTCVAGREKCPCKNNVCNAGLTCLSSVCVNAGMVTSTASSTAAVSTVASSTSSSAATSGSGGAAASASSASSTAAASGGAGGATGSGGGATGSGGAATSSTAASSSAGAGGALGNCMDPNVIDDFSSCDKSICNINGRSGMWKTVAPAGTTCTPGGTPCNFDVNIPGGSWVDQTCTAFANGGVTAAYVGFGAQLANGNAYDLSKWSGMTLVVESSHPVWLQLKAMDGGVFQVQMPGMAGPSVPHSIKFSDMVYVGGTGGSMTLALNKITDIQIMADMPSGFGYAVHSIVLDN